MRTTLLTCAVLALTASAASAQTYIGPWQPRPAIGVGVGAFQSGSQAGGGSKLLLSGTFEIPFSDNGRFRIEGGRGTIPLTAPADAARISRLLVSVAGLSRPGAPVSPYFGGGVGLYRATVDNGPTLPVRVGVHAHAGAEVLLSDTVSLDAELGIHVLNGTLLNEKLFGEGVIRIKVGL